MKVFLIRPVRGISQEYKEDIEHFITTLEAVGHDVYDPARDTNQRDPVGLDICKQNRQAITDCDVVNIIWDGKSTGSLFDLGMAFAMNKKIYTVIGMFPNSTMGKSFANMVYAWEEYGSA